MARGWPPMKMRAPISRARPPRLVHRRRSHRARHRGHRLHPGGNENNQVLRVGEGSRGFLAQAPSPDGRPTLAGSTMRSADPISASCRSSHATRTTSGPAEDLGWENGKANRPAGSSACAAGSVSDRKTSSRRRKPANTMIPISERITPATPTASSRPSARS